MLRNKIIWTEEVGSSLSSVNSTVFN